MPALSVLGCPDANKMTIESDLNEIFKKLVQRMNEAKSFQRGIARRVEELEKEISELKAKKALQEKKMAESTLHILTDLASTGVIAGNSTLDLAFALS
jgi:hypothetical protein